MTEDSIHRTTVDARPPVDRATALTSLHASARAGRPGFTVLRGPAGSGRTTLLRTVRDTCLGQDVLVLEAAGHATSPAAYSTVRTLLAPLGLPLPGSRILPHPTMAERVNRILVKLTARTPVALFVDDAHLCDEHSMRLLDLLLRRGSGPPVLVLLTDCPDEAGPARRVLREISARSPQDTIDLPPLRPSEVARAVSNALGRTPDPRFTLRCTELSRGNPSLLQRLLTELRHQNIRPDTGGIRFIDETGRRLSSSFAVAGLARRTSQVQRVGQSVALLGEAAEPELVSGLAGISLPAAVTALESLRRAGLLAPGGAGYQPDLLRSGLRSRLFVTVPEQELRTLRNRAAQLLSDAGRPAEEIARLLPRNPGQLWMLDVLREASAATARRGALLTAAAYLGRVVSSTADAIPDSQRINDRLELAGILARTYPPTAIPHLRWVLDRVTDPRLRARVTIRLGAAAVATEHSAEAVALLQDMMASLRVPDGTGAGPDGDELRAYAEYTRAALGLFDGTDSTAGERATGFTGPADATPAGRGLLIMNALGAALRTRRREHTVELLRRGLRVPETAGDTSRWPLAPQLPAAVVLYLADQADEARALLVRAQDEYSRRADPWVQLLVLSAMSLISHAVGDIASAAREARAAQAIVARTPDAAGLALPTIARLLVLVEQDRADSAQAVLDRIDDRHAACSPYEQSLLRMADARLKLLRGDPVGALRITSRCESDLADVGISNPVFVRWRLLAGQALDVLDRSGEVAVLAEESEELARFWDTPWAVGLSLLLTSLAADGRRSVDLLEEAVEVLSRSPGRMDLAWAEYRLGSALLHLGDSRGARDHLARASGLATRSGSRRLGSQARALLTAAGGRTRRATDLLTSCERRVAVLAAQGATNQEIADRLFITRRTVESHLTRAYRKLPVEGRADLRAVLGRPDVPGPSPVADPLPPRSAGGPEGSSIDY